MIKEFKTIDTRSVLSSLFVLPGLATRPTKVKFTFNSSLTHPMMGGQHKE